MLRYLPALGFLPFCDCMAFRIVFYTRVKHYSTDCKRQCFYLQTNFRKSSVAPQLFGALSDKGSIDAGVRIILVSDSLYMCQHECLAYTTRSCRFAFARYVFFQGNEF